MAVLTIRIYKQAIRQAEQKAADAAVHSRIAASAENKVRTILDSINEAVFIHELDTGRIVDVNRKAAELYGYPRERLLAMDPVNLMSDAAPLDHPMVTRRTAALDLHTAYLFEQQSKRSDGSLFWAEVNISKAEIDGVVRIVASVRDITERKRIEDDRARLEEKLRQSEKMDAIGQLAGGVAHDFNNQLTGILGYAELTKMAAVSEDIRNYASFIIDSARKAADLTQELLSFSRKTNIQDIPVDIHECIEKTSSILKRSIDKRIAILSRLDAERFVVTGDPSRMQNALLNLALNARDAMPSGGTILFSTRNVPELPDSIPKPVFTPSAGYLLVEVADTGIGIPREIQKRVFEPFFTTKGVGKGTGLGLASVFSTVQGHQGHITFYSEPGKGTVFKIWLPAPVREADHITAQDASSAPQRKLRVLLVDDEPMVRRIGSELLRSLGHSVVPMANGPDAIASFRESPDEFDLVLLDMIMPDMNGRDVYAALRSIRHDIKVLLVSGFSMDSDTQMAIRAGADGFLQKPYNMNELKRAINSIG
jgi:PAS domain S-box-containing protein